MARNRRTSNALPRVIFAIAYMIGGACIPLGYPFLRFYWGILADYNLYTVVNGLLCAYVGVGVLLLYWLGWLGRGVNCQKDGQDESPGKSGCNGGKGRASEL